MAKIKRAEMDKYGETKKRYQIMLTATALQALDTGAENLGITRSEYLERWIRRDILNDEVKVL